MRLQTESTAVFGDYFISKQTDKSEFEQIPICGGRSLTSARTLPVGIFASGCYPPTNQNLKMIKRPYDAVGV